MSKTTIRSRRQALKYKLVLLCVLCMISLHIHAQNHTELLKIADNLYEQGAYADAAEYYERAWRTKTTKRDLIFKAGECYLWSKDYRRAVECFQFVKDENDKYALVGLKYARSLKQDGRYRDAVEAFKAFQRNYAGEKSAELEKIIKNDIEGCEMGIALTNNQSPLPSDVKLSMLPEIVNTMENEFGLVPYSDHLLYFSSTFQGKARIYRTERIDGEWQQPAAAQGLPKPVEDHFGNGCFSPDGAHFYFTECKANETSRSGLQALCAISVTSRSPEGAWSEPVKLREYINWKGATTTQPFVYEENGNEVLLFVSDKEGGYGGLDLYRCERPLSSDDLDFSLPVNLGEQVNTPGDELSPYFDIAGNTLYFSSNGLVSLGGLDIFSSKYAENAWSKPENLGVPYNSTADDFGMVLKKSGNGGFLVSNRRFGQQKTNTRHEDIFEFLPIQRQVVVNGKVFSEKLRRTLPDCDISLLEILGNGNTRMLTAIHSADGHFSMPIMPSKHYRLDVATKEGLTSSTLLETNGTQLEYPLDIFIKDNIPPLPEQPAQVSSKTTATKGKDKGKTSGNTTKAADSVYYKVQLEAVPAYTPSEEKYKTAINLGKISTEKAADPQLTRLLVGKYTDKDAAEEAAQKMRESGHFPQAYVVKYNNGKRVNNK